MRTLFAYTVKPVDVVQNFLVNPITMFLCFVLSGVGVVGGWYAANHHDSFAYARDIALVPASILLIGLIDEMLDGDDPLLGIAMCSAYGAVAAFGNFAGGFHGFESRWAWLSLAAGGLIWVAFIEITGFLGARSRLGAFVDTLFYAAAVTAVSAVATYGVGWAAYACLIAAGATFIIKLMVDRARLGFGRSFAAAAL